MNRPLLTLLTLLLVSLHSLSQEKSYTIPNSHFLQFIRNSRFNSVKIRPNYSKASQLLKLNGTRFDNYTQFILTAEQQIFVYIGATGVVYKSIGEVDSDSVTFVRMDKTEHYGYNINAYPFIYKNQLFNIGGYGFWHWNGHLRIFSEKSHEWDIIPLNKEIPVAVDYPGSNLWISELEHKLYAFSYIKGNEAVKTKVLQPIEHIDSVIELDLQNFEWKSKGELNNKYRGEINQQTCFANLDSGLLFCNNAPHIFYLNIIANRIDTLQNIDLYHFYASTTQDVIYWYKSGYFYKANLTTSAIDSMQLDYADLKKGDTPIYVENNQKIASNKYLYLLIIIPILLLVYRNKRFFKQKANPAPTENEIKLTSPYRKNDLFDEVEKALIKHLYENAKNKGTRTSTEEVNRILGVGNKSIDMQKRKRSDVIKSINKKYQMIQLESDQILIERTKSEVDARLYEYVLNSENLDFIG